MASAQKGTEFALCLNSFNRDVEAYPDTNDFRLDLMDRYDMQMMVLGSLELPYTQFLIEEPWSTFSYDVGLSLFSIESRSLRFVFHGKKDDTVVMLPAPYLPVHQSSPITFESVYEHGLGPSSLTAFAPDSVRIFLIPDDPGTPIKIVKVTKILSPIRVQVASPVPDGQRGLLVVAEANTRTFSSPASLVRCLQAFCSNPFPDREYLRRLHFSYSTSTMELSIEVDEKRLDVCHGKGSDYAPIAINTVCEPNLLTSLGFHVPCFSWYELRCLISSNYPVQNACRSPLRISVPGLPTKPVCTEYDLSNPPTCVKSDGPPCIEPGTCVQQVHIPPANYEWNVLQRITEHRINNKTFLEIPPPTPSDGIQVFFWDVDLPDDVLIPRFSTYHPGGTAVFLTKYFAAAGIANKLVWVYQDDRFIVRPLQEGVLFRIQWPANVESGQQMLPFRLRIDESIMFASEIQSEQLHYCPSPTHISMPASNMSMQISMTKRYIFTARPKVITGHPHHPVTKLGVIAPKPPGDQVVQIQLGVLPLETPVLIYDPDDISTKSAFGYVACHSTAKNATFIVLLSADDAALDITTEWLVDALSLLGGAFNIYFPTAHLKCWSRLAEIYGFPSGASLWTPNILVAPWQWNLDQPPYLLLDLGLQHVSATITHRCGQSVLSGFFGKIVLYPPFKEMRMTPIQAIGTGVSVVSSLHLRLLNPWHQLYELHGRNWSITVILASATKGARTDCL